MSTTVSLDTGFRNNGETALTAIVKQAVSLVLGHRERVRARNRLRWELSQYSDRELADMGLSRSDIEDVVQGRRQN